MECSCSIDSGWDGDTTTLLREEWRKARKIHGCSECGGPIRIGDRYYIDVLADDGRIRTYKTCTKCKDIRDVFFITWVYGEIWDDIREMFYEGLPPAKCMAELTKPARDKLCDFIEALWGDEED